MDSYKRVDVTELRKGLAGVIESAQTGPVILRNHGEEVAALVSIEVMRNVQ